MTPLAAETLVLEGPDAVAFAHAQFCSDVRSLAVGDWQWSAWLNPQGRVRALMHLIRTTDDRLSLLLRGGTAIALATALRPYILRLRVTLTISPVGSLDDAPSLPCGHSLVDGTDIILGLGDYAMRMTRHPATLPQHWRSHAICAGHPWLPDATLGTLLAPSLSLQKLGALSLDKGCFPGQEIVARLHYRGGCKQHLRHVESAVGLNPGGTLLSNGESVGIVLDSARNANGTHHALAVLHDVVPSGRIMLGVDQSSHQTSVITNLS